MVFILELWKYGGHDSGWRYVILIDFNFSRNLTRSGLEKEKKNNADNFEKTTGEG
jgi:hypothetical protein